MELGHNPPKPSVGEVVQYTALVEEFIRAMSYTNLLQLNSIVTKLYSLIALIISKKVALITGLLACCFGVYSFGKPFLFDRAYILLLVSFAAYSFHIDKNSSGIFAVLSLERIFEETMFFLSSNEWQFKLLVVGLCIAVCYKLRYDKLIWVVIGALLSLVLAEIYWFVVDYETPTVYWHLVILFQSLIVRHFIFFRPTIMVKMFPDLRGVKWIYTDLQIYQIMSVYVVIELLRLAEY